MESGRAARVPRPRGGAGAGVVVQGADRAHARRRRRDRGGGDRDGHRSAAPFRRRSGSRRSTRSAPGARDRGASGAAARGHVELVRLRGDRHGARVRRPGGLRAAERAVPRASDGDRRRDGRTRRACTACAAPRPTSKPGRRRHARPSTSSRRSHLDVARARRLDRAGRLGTVAIQTALAEAGRATRRRRVGGRHPRRVLRQRRRVDRVHVPHLRQGGEVREPGRLPQPGAVVARLATRRSTSGCAGRSSRWPIWASPRRAP